MNNNALFARNITDGYPLDQALSIMLVFLSEELNASRHPAKQLGDCVVILSHTEKCSVMRGLRAWAWTPWGQVDALEGSSL